MAEGEEPKVNIRIAKPDPDGMRGLVVVPPRVEQQPTQATTPEAEEPAAPATSEGEEQGLE